MKLNFNISDFNISGKPIPEQIADKILKWHILPMQRVRDIFNQAIWANQSSGYRSISWERSKRRSGNSQHTFQGKGAVDWTCRNFASNHERLLELIKKETDYTRMAIYSSFIHCDYKPTPNGRREVYTSNSKSKWTLKETI